MNFFGHLFIACELDREPGFAFGSMLPDFATMAKVRLRGEVQDKHIEAGVAFHHKTDAVFHSAPTFVQAQQAAMAELEPRVGRGPAMAIAHVGVEMLLDGHLVASPSAQAAYLAALNAGTRSRPLGLDAEPEAAIARLVDRIVSYGVPHGYSDPEWVADRLFDILRPRARLAIPPAAAPQLRSWSAKMQSQLRPQVSELIEEVRSGLGLT